MRNTIEFAWRHPRASEGFTTGVCLHGHTMHSEECLSFLPRYLHQVPGISQVAGFYERGSRRIDFGRAWWTPPLSPASALRLEREQVASMALRPLVSLTDHDNIDAGLALGVTADPRETPISVEWTVPYRRSIFHIGVHNMPRAAARRWMAEMAEYTAAAGAAAMEEYTAVPGAAPMSEHTAASGAGAPAEHTAAPAAATPAGNTPARGAAVLRALLDEFSRTPGVLVVLNHPFWLEEGVREEDHPQALAGLLRECAGWIDAFELNGTRPWSENARTIVAGP